MRGMTLSPLLSSSITIEERGDVIGSYDTCCPESYQLNAFKKQKHNIKHLGFCGRKPQIQATKTSNKPSWLKGTITGACANNVQPGELLLQPFVAAEWEWSLTGGPPSALRLTEMLHRNSHTPAAHLQTCIHPCLKSSRKKMIGITDSSEHTMVRQENKTLAFLSSHISMHLRLLKLFQDRSHTSWKR